MSTILPRFDYRADFAMANYKGARREHQEDAALLAPEIALFAVADSGCHQHADQHAVEHCHSLRHRMAAGG